MSPWREQTGGHVRIWRAATTAAILLSAASIVLSGWSFNRSAGRAHEAADTAALIQARIVDSCQRNGNRLRRAISHNIDDQIKQAKAGVKLSIKFLPDIPKSVIYQSTRKRVKSLREQRRRVAPINCAAQFKQ